jgi:hypothetical protein
MERSTWAQPLIASLSPLLFHCSSESPSGGNEARERQEGMTLSLFTGDIITCLENSKGPATTAKILSDKLKSQHYRNLSLCVH